MPPMRERFNFHVLELMIHMETKKLCRCKVTKSNDIPVKILKQNVDIFLTAFVTVGKFSNLLNPFVVDDLILHTLKIPKKGLNKLI